MVKACQEALRKAYAAVNTEKSAEEVDVWWKELNKSRVAAEVFS